MPFDTKTISILESVNLMAQASWFERYLIGIGYGVFSEPNVSDDYRVLDSYTPSYGMPDVISRLNTELKKLGFNKEVLHCSTMPGLIKNLRSVIWADDKRAALFDWLIGNQDETLWEEAKKQEVWNLGYEELFAFCQSLQEKRLTKLSQ